ncbi:MAG: hypothetical protein HRU11_12450 [Parvularculaceae bacterium]|nr:hypothetical protein [Parvularculaceae bacterium]
MLVSAAAAAFATLVGAQASAVTIDFESRPAESDLTNEIAGITVEAFENGSSVGGGFITSFNGAHTSQGLWNLVDDLDFTDANRADEMVVTFDVLVSNVSFFHNGFDDTTLIEARDAGGNVLESVTASGSAQNIALSAGNIAALVFFQSQDDFTYVVDNLTFDAGAAPVPVPAAGLLFGGALIAGLKRRRQK